VARKPRRKSGAKAKKGKRAKTRRAKTKRAKTKVKAKAATRKKPARKARAKAQPKSITEKVAGAFQTLVDTFKETGTLRNKLATPGSSETA
jgi:hypothetical protein